MRFIDELRVLERKVSLIDRPMQDGRWAPPEVDIIETAFWARSVLEIIEDVEFHKYGHSLKLSIRTTRSVSDPDHPGSAKAVYEHNRNISLKKLLEFIIHFRHFSFNRHVDGNHCLDVISDRNVRQQVYYSDFTEALRSLVLSRRLVGLAFCDLAERDLLRMAKENWSPADGMIFPSLNLFSLLHEHVKSETELKLRIMDEVFGIADVPHEVLPELAFFQSQVGPSAKIVIGFGPRWESEQNVFSPPVDRSLLFNLIRSYYASK